MNNPLENNQPRPALDDHAEHRLREELAVLRAQRDQLRGSAEDHRAADSGDRAEALRRADDVLRIEDRIKEIIHLLAAGPGTRAGQPPHWARGARSRCASPTATRKRLIDPRHRTRTGTDRIARPRQPPGHSTGRSHRRRHRQLADPHRATTGPRRRDPNRGRDRTSPPRPTAIAPRGVSLSYWAVTRATGWGVSHQVFVVDHQPDRLTRTEQLGVVADQHIRCSPCRDEPRPGDVLRGGGR